MTHVLKVLDVSGRVEHAVRTLQRPYPVLEQWKPGVAQEREADRELGRRSTGRLPHVFAGLADNAGQRRTQDEERKQEPRQERLPFEVRAERRKRKDERECVWRPLALPPSRRPHEEHAEDGEQDDEVAAIGRICFMIGVRGRELKRSIAR